jgi:hypothetical protein
LIDDTLQFFRHDESRSPAFVLASPITGLAFLIGYAGGCIAASRLPFSIAAPLTEHDGRQVNFEIRILMRPALLSGRELVQ